MILKHYTIPRRGLSRFFRERGFEKIFEEIIVEKDINMSKAIMAIKMSSSLENILIKIDGENDANIVCAFSVRDKRGREREVECAFTLLDENGNPIGEPMKSGAFAGMSTPTMHIPPVEVFELEYGVEYIEGFLIDGRFYTREAADIELGQDHEHGHELQSEELYGAYTSLRSPK